jgi:hypothetical protein
LISALDILRLKLSGLSMPIDLMKPIRSRWIEMASQQHHGVLKFALAAVQRALPKSAGHDRRSDRDRRDQDQAAGDQPADRAAPNGGPRVERGASICHGRF